MRMFDPCDEQRNDGGLGQRSAGRWRGALPGLRLVAAALGMGRKINENTPDFSPLQGGLLDSLRKQDIRTYSQALEEGEGIQSRRRVGDQVDDRWG